MNIVIIEDDGITAFYLQETLSNLGCTLKGIFDNAQSLLLFLRESSVDTIFMDINIKGRMDGLQLAQKVHATYPEISFVFVTSYKDSQTILEAQSVKPLGYLIKPITESDLEAIVMIVKGQSGHISNDKNNTIMTEKKLKYDTTTQIFYRDKTPLPLSVNEQICLNLLVKNKNNYIGTEQLIQAIWSDSDKKRENSLRELIYRLRKKLSPLTITSTAHLGYCLNL